MRSIIKLLLSLFIISNLFAQSNIVVGIIEDEIDLGLVPYVQRVITEAEKNNADAIIFKINTFGGRVDAATQIKDAIINSKIRTIAFIDKRAISAGALIALSCQKIYMVDGASIGASTVVDQSGTKQAEKYQSYMRSEMRATAEKNKRPVKLAEAMVDERIVVEGLVDSTQLVTLTTEEAIKYKMADSVANSIEDIANIENLENAEFNKIESNWAEAVVRFLNNPIISSLLIMIGLVGLFTEIKSPGWGVPGTAGIIALTLFFGSGLILNISSVLEIIIFIVGVILILVEIFVIPGFGVSGILGIIMIISSIFLGLITDFHIVDSSLISEAILQLTIALILSITIIIILWKYLPKTKTFNKFVLSDNIDAKTGYLGDDKFSNLINQYGQALTDLRPSGIGIFNESKYDISTEGEYITKDTKIIVSKIEGLRIIVKEVK